MIRLSAGQKLYAFTGSGGIVDGAYNVDFFQITWSEGDSDPNPDDLDHGFIIW